MYGLKVIFATMVSLFAASITLTEATARATSGRVPEVFYRDKQLVLRPIPRLFDNRMFIASTVLAQYSFGYAFIADASIIIMNSNHRIGMRIGPRKMDVAILTPASSREQTLPDPPIRVNGQVYIPLRAIIEALGGSVEYHAANFRVVLYSGTPTPSPLETTSSTLSASAGESTRKISVVHRSIETSLKAKAAAPTVSIPAIASNSTATSDFAGVLAMNSADGGVMVVDAATGRVRWRVSGEALPEQEVSSSRLATLCPDRPCENEGASPLHGVLMLRAGDSGITRRVIAHDLRSGRVLWTRAGLYVGAFGPAVLVFRPTPPTNQGTLETLDLRSGQLRGSTSPNFLGASGILIDPTRLFVRGGAQGAITTTATAVLDWPSGTRIGWYKIDTGALLYADRGRLALQVTSLAPDAESYRPFVATIVDARSGRVLLPGNGEYVYAPDPQSVSAEHPHDYSRAEADQVVAGPRWTWMRLFGTWYRYRSDIDPRRDHPIRIDGLGDVLGVLDDQNLFARTSDGGLAVVHAITDRVLLRQVRLAGKIGYVQVIGQVAYLQAGTSFYLLDLLQAKITARYTLPCKSVNSVIPWRHRITLLCNSARSASLSTLYH